jgi:EGF-like domain/Tenascin EGF domain
MQAGDHRAFGLQRPMRRRRSALTSGPGPQIAAAFAALALVLGAPAPVLGAPLMDQPAGNNEPGQWRSMPCTGHGHTDSGRCFCNAGWSGDACDTPAKTLECGDHGKAANGWCVCEPGWKGRTCQSAPVSCTHGKVADGKCVCDAGWSGDVCNKGP